MADTGAPWNIPYATPTNLVRDYPDLSEDIAEAIADNFDTVYAFTGILQRSAVIRTTTITGTGLGLVIVPCDSISFTPLRADSLLQVQWIGRYEVNRNASSPRDRGVRLSVSEGGTPIGSHDGGRELISTSSASSAMSGLINVIRYKVSGSTSTRTITSEMFPLSNNLKVESFGDVDIPNFFIVTEFAAGSL